jgi:hypothetical protein
MLGVSLVWSRLDTNSLDWSKSSLGATLAVHPISAATVSSRTMTSEFFAIIFVCAKIRDPTLHVDLLKLNLQLIEICCRKIRVLQVNVDFLL